METQAGDAGEEKRLPDIALTGRVPAAPGQTRGKKKLISKQESIGVESHRR